MGKKRKKKIPIFDYVNLGILTVLMLLVLIPFFLTIVKSLMLESEYALTPVAIWPKNPTLSNYKDILTYGGIGRSFVNSVIIVVLGVAYGMFITVTLAYGLSKKNFPGRAFFQNFVIFTMFFGGGLVPFFIVVKKLGMMDSLASVIIPIGFNVFNMIIMRNFIEQIPPELEEAAKIDGAGQARILVQIILPMVKPALATVGLFYAVDRWNEWFWASIFIGKSELFPVQLILRNILFSSSGYLNVPPEAGRNIFADGLKAASVVIVMLPVMTIYPFLQKYFVKGVMVGAVKS